VANLLVYIELEGDRPVPASLEALGEGRRVATHLGATLYAVLPAASALGYASDDAVAVLSRHGADRVILAGAPARPGPTLHATHGAALHAATERVPPAMLLVAATAGGRDLAPRAAARLGAAYVAEASIEYGAPGEVVLWRELHGRTWRSRLAAGELERPIVVTLTPGSVARAHGDEEADVLVLDAATAPPPAALAEVARRADPGAALDAARVVVTAGAGVSPEDFPLVCALAEALGGEVAVTRGAVERGLDGAHREIGVGGRNVSPRLYVAVGASGSAEHLAAVAPDALIVAINPDARAPIFRVASYGLVAAIADAAPALIAAARGEARESVS
jgi:electron transfer flavoprotein alpha subunit